MLEADVIKSIRDSSQFLALRDHILNEVNELDSVNGLGQLDNSKAGEEAKIRLKTRDLLIKIFKPFVDFYEKKDPTDEEIQKAKDKTGL